MLRYIFLFIFTSCFCSIYGQSFWLKYDVSKGTFIDAVANAEYNPSEIKNKINFNPCFKVGDQPIHHKIDKEQLNQTQIFTVYQPNHKGEEQHIWSIKTKDTDQLILTTNRMADLQSKKYMNFLDQDFALPKINNYHHYKSSYKGDELTIGGLPSRTDIPVSTFEGDIAELMLFENTLSPLAKQQIETYLSIKYSIPIDTYIDGNGHLIWSTKDESIYFHRTASIGKSKLTNLNQLQSESNIERGMMGFSLGSFQNFNYENTSQLNDESYLLWSDDDGSLDFLPIQDEVSRIARKWKWTPHNWTTESNLSFFIEEKSIIENIKKDNNLYLIQSQTMDFDNVKEMNIQRLEKSANQYVGTNITTEDYEYFSLVQSPPFWAAMSSNDSECNQANGSIDIQMIGGVGPFFIQVISEDLDYSYNSKDKNLTIENLSSEAYKIIVSDSEGNSYQNELEINDDNLPTDVLKSNYVSIDGQPILINPNIENIDQSLDYEWRLPDGTTSNNKTITALNSGTYNLKIINGKCQKFEKTQVTIHQSSIRNISLSPNPTVDGHFQLNAELNASKPYAISIHDLSGQLMFHKYYEANQYISNPLFIPHQGTYVVTLSSAHSSKSTQVVVIR